ncbi:hypothetical protein ABC270_01405 [Curtobacterium sp. 1P10AnD]|uniref:hypothetical protein n=1 Tax=Curtobacterium sp. 1P10AnD TaxID=3132283 RepID=UPI00399FB8FD
MSTRALLGSLGPTFLRPPRGAGWAADVVRVFVALSVPVAAIGWGAIDLAVAMLALFGAVVPRMLGLRPAVDVAVVVSSSVAAWSSTLDWYTTVPGWDKAVHVVLVGLLGILLCLIAYDLGVLHDVRTLPVAALVVVCGAAGLAIGAVWEMGEWVGHTFLDATIFVGYDDTIGDLLADLVGALGGGALLRWAASGRRVVRPSERPPTIVA